jgi:hypothetical protein
MNSWATKSLRLEFIVMLAIETGTLLIPSVGCNISQVEDANF